MTTLYPLGYGTRLVPLDELRRVHEPKMHPEFARRLWPWLELQGGRIGIGSGWRLTQPDKPGVAPEGRSFHQDQRFASGFVGYCAVDLVARDPGKVHRSPSWAEVPAQGSPAAAVWGVHCNVGLSPGGEPWHMQPFEIDGWQSWVNAGRLDPAYHPLPTEAPPMATLAKSVRVLDTRASGAKLFAGDVRRVGVLQPPAWAGAAIVDIGVAETDAAGFITAWSGQGERPGTSVQDFAKGVTSSNLWHVPLHEAPDGGWGFAVYAHAATHLVVDLVGWDAVA